MYEKNCKESETVTFLDIAVPPTSAQLFVVVVCKRYNAERVSSTTFDFTAITI